LLENTKEILNFLFTKKEYKIIKDKKENNLILKEIISNIKGIDRKIYSLDIYKSTIDLNLNKQDIELLKKEL